MTKFQARFLKSHYQSRWTVLRHNQKNNDKILLFNDQFVLKNLTPGKTLAYNCLGDMYHDIIPNLSLTAGHDRVYNNLVLINNTEFKYKTLEQISEFVENLAESTLLRDSRIILSFEHRFLVYNRVEVSVNSMLANWPGQFKQRQMLNLLRKTQPGYGDYFFCLDYK